MDSVLIPLWIPFNLSMAYTVRNIITDNIPPSDLLLVEEHKYSSQSRLSQADFHVKPANFQIFLLFYWC